ncbi:MAG: zinc-finger-containing protein [Breznakia sp.]
MVDLFPKKCNLCGGEVKLISSTLLYKRAHGSGYMYLCNQCFARVGTHQHKPMEAFGILANQEMREKKIFLHSLFDPHWDRKSKYYIADRKPLYQKLADWLGIDVSECHFGYFDMGMLNQAQEIIEIWRYFMKIDDMNINIEIKAPELVDAINTLANAFIGSHVKKPAGIPSSELGEEIKTAPENKPEVVEENYENPKDLPTYSQDELRAAATVLAKNGAQNDLIALFKSVGADKLSEVETEHSGLVMDRMQELIKAKGLE